MKNRGLSASILESLKESVDTDKLLLKDIHDIVDEAQGLESSNPKKALELARKALSLADANDTVVAKLESSLIPNLVQYVENLKNKVESLKDEIRNSKEDIKEDVSNDDEEYLYQLLDRLKSDCDYYLNNGNRDESVLWAGNVKDQLEMMKEVYNSLNEKPDWITMDDIEAYNKKMTQNVNESSSLEDYWDAKVVDKKNFKTLLKFNFGNDSKGNNYIVTNDANEVGRFHANSDEEAINKFKTEFLKEEETLVVNDMTPDPDYKLIDVTVLEPVGDGDVLSPDMQTLLVMADQELTESAGANWGRINILSSRAAKDGTNSNALFELRLRESTYLMSFVIKGLAPLREFEVYNTDGKCKFRKKTTEPVKVMKEFISQFIVDEPLNESENKPDKKEIKKTIEEFLKHSLSNSLLPDMYEMIQEEIETYNKHKDIADVGDVLGPTMYKKLRQRINGFVSQLPVTSIGGDTETYQIKDGILIYGNSATGINLKDFDSIIETLFGAEWIDEEVKTDKDLEKARENTLKESETVNKDADKLIRDYYNYKMDLTTLHSKLEKLFGNKKDAARYLIKNDKRVKNLKETTNKELEARKSDLRARERQALKDLGDKDYENLARDLSKILPEDLYNQFKNEEDELDCISMIHSILTYSSNHNTEAVLNNKYLQDYINSLGIDKVKDLVNQEIEEFKNATINTDVYTDGEGVSYNSVTFKDDVNESEKKSRLPNISKFIYDIDSDKGNAWSVSSYTEDGNGNKIIIVDKNGTSENTAKDIKKAVENKYPRLKGYETENGKHIWFYLKESVVQSPYRNITIGDIVATYNVTTGEIVYSIPSKNINDKKKNINDIEKTDVPYDTETIIRNYIETNVATAPAVEEDKEVKAEVKPNGTEEVKVKDTEKVDEADGDNQDVNNPAPNGNGDEEAITDETKSETGSEFFFLKPKSVEYIQDALKKGVSQGKSTYVVVKTVELPDDEFEKYSNDLQGHYGFLSDVDITDMDTKNFSFNCIKVTSPNASYSVLADPVGYDYTRYGAIINK